VCECYGNVENFESWNGFWWRFKDFYLDVFRIFWCGALLKLILCGSSGAITDRNKLKVIRNSPKIKDFIKFYGSNPVTFNFVK